MVKLKKGSILSEDTEKEIFQGKILSKFLSGESLTGFWVPHAGMRKSLTYLLQNSEDFGFKKLGKYKIIYVAWEDMAENSVEEYFRLMLLGLDSHVEVTKNESIFFALKRTVKKYLDEEYSLIFILRKFDDVDFGSGFFNNLKTLWQINKTKFHYIFAVNKDICSGENFKKYDQLRDILSQNLVYFPLLSKNDSDNVVNYLIDKYGYKVGDKQKSYSVLYGGGNASLIKGVLRAFTENPEIRKDKIEEFLMARFDIKIVLEDIWDCLTEAEKINVNQAANKLNIESDSVPRRLLEQNIIIKAGTSFELFSPLFKEFVRNQRVEKQSVSFDPRTEDILISGVPIKEKITLNEYNLLVFLLKNKSKVISRDQIGDILWGKGSYEQYSDWAIDQLVSQLRKKIKKLGVNVNSLQTVRNRGYRWVD